VWRGGKQFETALMKADIPWKYFIKLNKDNVCVSYGTFGNENLMTQI
jgi:hypothetical protein